MGAGIVVGRPGFDSV